MLFRPLGKTGLNVSVLGFGCMRLPVLGGRHSQIDEPKASAMLHYAIENGVNYVDTAYSYHGTGPFGAGNSEPFVGRALRGGYREKVHLATKLPCWLVKSRQDMDNFLNQQLESLQTDHLDVYLLHALNASQWLRLRDLGVCDFLETARADGRIGQAGFSFHDELAVFMQILTAYDWDCCQIQFNYMDEEFQAGAAGLQFAGTRDLGVIIMEPLRGGSLTGRVPAEVQAVWDRSEQQRSPAEWALRYVWNQPEVSTVLSGMSSLEQVQENIRSAAEALPNSLSYAEIDLYEEVKRVYRSRFKVDCTSCQYCMPCPNGVNIPGNFEIMNRLAMFEDMKASRFEYRHLQSLQQDAGLCTQCGICELNCPQFIEIGDELEEIARIFE